MNQLLKTLLYEWRDKKLPETLGRDSQLDVSPQTGSNTATVITGFRRVGKTYLVYEAIERLLETYSREEVIYLNFEDERVVNPTVEILTDLIPEIQATFGKKPKYLFLDELQLVPNWSKWVRRILDSESIQLYITGSSSKMSSSELPTELRGRALEVKVDPLSFKEFLRFKEAVVDNNKLLYVKEEAGRFSYLFNEYLVFGALPAVVLTAPEKKQELLQTYYQTVVQREIVERHGVENDMLLKTLLQLLLNSTSVTISKLHNTLKGMGIPVGKTTVDNYISYIESSYFMKELYFHSQNILNQLNYPRKVYFVDTGFLTALSTKFSKNMGRLLENKVFHKLAQMYETLYYYKDDRDNEIDFTVLEDGKVTALYQVCYDLTDEETQVRELRTFTKAGDTLNCSNFNLIVLEKPKLFTMPAGVKLITASEFFG